MVGFPTARRSGIARARGTRFDGALDQTVSVGESDRIRTRDTMSCLSTRIYPGRLRLRFSLYRISVSPSLIKSRSLNTSS